MFDHGALVPFPKFVILSSTRFTNFGKKRALANLYFLVPLIDLKLLIEFSACSAGISNRRH
jgi:hypothetical protein